MPHSRAALATYARRVTDAGGHLYEVSRHTEACATDSDHLRPTDPVSVPDLAALARGSSPSIPTCPRSPRTHIRHLALRGGLRDTLRRFTPPRPALISEPFRVSPGSITTFISTHQATSILLTLWSYTLTEMPTPMLSINILLQYITIVYKP
ncbi:hypothetical protein EDB84DRAFT_1565684 [Lactarius hengduanensis]|nr:hypothetical protein EDB85DRAFT_2156593 [Lactarius pseudohatsudake]KAH9020519.1 hypothetical protein EDB84DRAFT_1565684 [Lactarius hengduanensis]